MALDFPSTGKSSRVRMVSEDQIPLPLQSEIAAQIASPPSVPNSTPSGQGYQTAVLATFSTIARVLAARVILLLATAGAFALAYLCMQSTSQMAIATTAIYDIFVLLPLVYLTATRN